MSKRVCGQIKITLRSDLCVGSGYSHAGVIDSDVCYDETGFPYIPAKRLRGCIRETLENSLYARYPEQADALFGKAGDKAPASLVIGNAYPAGHDALRRAIKQARKDDARRVFYDTQRILESYTRVIGQTRLEDGVAMEGSLRYTRTVNRKSPLTGEDMVFYAEASCDNDRLGMLKDALRGTRHIGLKRNRGLGNVTCEWLDESETEQNKEEMIRETTADGMTTLTYRFRNVAPLMISGVREDVTRSYIPGANVLGVLAARFLQEDGATADSEAFRDLFLNGKTTFTNAYPCDSEKIYYPAPEYINRLKKTKDYVCNLRTAPEDAQRNMMSEGNQPKKLKGKYVAWDQTTVSVIEVDTDIAYHHSHYKKNADGEQGILYGMEVIRAGQTFAGQVILPSQYAEKVKTLLAGPDLYFGKSKSSQYGKCVLEDAFMPDTQKSVIPAGSRVVVTLLSDAVFVNAEGAYTILEEEVREKIAEALGIKGEPDDRNLSYIQTTLATGYSAIWNLRKPAAPAVRAGSCLAYVLSEDCSAGEAFVGERNLEGFGQVRIEAADERQFLMEEGIPAEEDDRYEEDASAGLRELMREVLLRSWLEKQRYAALSQKKLKVSDSSRGRITMMLRESLDMYPKDADHEKALDEFVRRIASIKSDGIRSEAEKLVKQIANGSGADRNWIFGSDAKEEGEELRRLGFTEEEIGAMMHGLWGEYLMTVLVQDKYQGGVQK